MKEMIIDNAHSEIGFKVKHLMISTVKGNFATFSGGVNDKGEINVSMNVNSINTGKNRFTVGLSTNLQRKRNSMVT